VLGSWEEGMRLPESEHTIPVFISLAICVTNIHAGKSIILFFLRFSEKRDSIKRAVETRGGKFEKDLTKKCTHLVTDEFTGDKCQAAVKWGIPIVHNQWIQDCVQIQSSNA
jgi:NAD-dependent DNA ligase